MSYGKPGWQLWEEEMAGRIGGDLVKASGRLTGYKGDVKTSRLLVDCKYTETQRYTLSSKMWRSVSEWNEANWDSYAVCEKGVRMSLGISEKTALPLVASMADGAWSEEVLAMELGRMLKLVGVHED